MFMVLLVAPVLHWYVVPPEAVSVVELPSQIDVFPVIKVTGIGLTVIVTLFFSVHKPIVSVTLII
jgi:hypothetical protein